jgi:hypothetical protein
MTAEEKTDEAPEVEDDVEAHSLRRSADPDFTSQAPSLVRASDDDDDAEGHIRS